SVIDPVRGALKCQHFFGFDGDAEGWPDIGREMEAATPVREAAEMDEDDVALLMYTSGTTGRPKGSMMTVGNAWWNDVNELLMLDIVSSDTVLTYAPMFHVGGLNVLTLTALLKGCHLVLHKAFDPGQVIADIERYKV